MSKVCCQQEQGAAALSGCGGVRELCAAALCPHGTAVRVLALMHSQHLMFFAALQTLGQKGTRVAKPPKVVGARHRSSGTGLAQCRVAAWSAW